MVSSASYGNGAGVADESVCGGCEGGEWDV
jgi:hypothetical protein